MTKDEALHKALKVLNCLNNDRVYETAWVKGAINACEEALEQPKNTQPLDEVIEEFMKDPAMKQAMDKAREKLSPLFSHPTPQTTQEHSMTTDHIKMLQATVDKSRATIHNDGTVSIGKPAQEPVGLKQIFDLSKVQSYKAFDNKEPTGYLYNNGTWVSNETDPLKNGVPFYTNPYVGIINDTHPAPSWQGLSDDEIDRIYCEVSDNCVKYFPSELYAAWFKALKEKNNV